MKKRLVFALLICLAALPAQAASIDLGFNDSSAQLEMTVPLKGDDYGTVQAEGRLLYNDTEETKLASVGPTFVGEPGNVPGLELGIGSLLYGGRTDHGQDLLAIGVSGRLTYAPPVLGGFGVTGKLNYAPHVFSWLDSERLLETGVRLSYAATPRVQVYLAYQNLRCDFEDRGDQSIDEEVRIGFGASF